MENKFHGSGDQGSPMKDFDYYWGLAEPIDGDATKVGITTT